MPRSTRRSDPGGPVIYLQDQRSVSPSASVLPGSAKDKERWRVGKKQDLAELVENELKQLLSDYPLDKDEVLKVGLAIKKQQQKQKENGDANSSSSYSSHDLESPRTQLALRLNAASKDLAKIRFSLVPSRLKEPVFWDATIHLVKERLVLYNERCQALAAAAMRGPPSHESVSRQLQFPEAHQESTTKPPNGNGNSSHKLLEELARKDAEIAELKLKLKEVQETLLDVAKLPSGPPASAPVQMNGSSNKCHHRGQWMMHKDSEEFLSYPNEVKQAMRAEKQRRLRQVQEEMKFILNSDNIEDTHGEWDCCGATEYHADCTRASI